MAGIHPSETLQAADPKEGCHRRICREFWRGRQAGHHALLPGICIWTGTADCITVASQLSIAKKASHYSLAISGSSVDYIERSWSLGVAKIGQIQSRATSLFMHND